MLAELLYFVSLALFGFVILGAAQLPSGIGLVIAIFPVFIAMIVGIRHVGLCVVRIRPGGERRLARRAGCRSHIGTPHAFHT